MEFAKEIERIMADREAFNAFVYTPFEEALVEIEKRQNDHALEAYVTKSLPAGLPPVVRKGKHAFLSRDVGTPNYETLRFISAVDVMEDFTPIIWEYGQDKFTPNQNELKRALGKMTFYIGHGKKGGEKTVRQGVVNFNTEEGKKLADVKTEWGQPLIVFLPAFMEILKETGQKPLIVPLSPTDIEGDQFWSYYPPQLSDYVKEKNKLQ